MNYGELKQAALDDTHRPDLSLHVARFVRQAEGMIRRDLAMWSFQGGIAFIDKVADGRYTLPVGCSQVKSIHQIFPNEHQGDTLQQVSPLAIRRLSVDSDVMQYCVILNNQVEFRGHPKDTDIFNVFYYGVPAPFVDDTDDNSLLTDHETLYMSATKFFLYLHTQDRELASDELDIFQGVLATLNDHMARLVGGASIAPTYNFSGGSSY